MSSGAADRIHVIGFDYRGFGYSTGVPTEAGLINDGIAVVKWALEVAKLPPNRIALVGQSLGTAVATAVAEHYASHHDINFAGLALIAGFSDLPTLLATYSIGGIIPILSPLQPYPRIQKFFASKIVDTWRTSTRLANLIRRSRNINLAIIHTKDDFDIHWTHSETLFYAAVNATSSSGFTRAQIDEAKLRSDLGDSGWLNTWATNAADSGFKRVKHLLLKHGGTYILPISRECSDHLGHNRIMTYPYVSKTVFDLFGQVK